MQGFVADLRCQAGHLRFGFESNVEDWLASQASELVLVFARKQPVYFLCVGGRLESEGRAGAKLVPQRPVAMLCGLLNLAADTIVRLM